MSKLVNITCEVVARREKSIAVADGTTEKYQGREKLKWFWLPLSVTQENDDGTVTIPEWLAQERGLI